MTTQTDYLAKTFYAMTVADVLTETQVEENWANGVRNHHKFLHAAERYVRHIKAEGLREASDAYPLETAYGGAEHAVLWLKERAEQIQEQK